MAAVEQACQAALAEARLPGEALGAMDAAIGLAGLDRKGVARAVDGAFPSVPLRPLRR
jgi:hypothetical protein